MSQLKTLVSLKVLLGNSYLSSLVCTKSLRTNYLFRVDLRPHLKQKGVHNSFHASLLRIHVPNDDQLFPGHLDTQLGSQNAPDSEWAVDQIEGHVGSRTDTKFKLKWKSSDTTLMPYYQITHLNTLESYFELLGIDKIDDLLAGASMDSYQDPQIFLEGLEVATTAPQGFNNMQTPNVHHTKSSTCAHPCSASSHPFMPCLAMTEHECGFDFSHSLLTCESCKYWILADPNIPGCCVCYSSHHI